MSSVYTLAEAQEMLRLHKEALKAVLLNQSYTIKDRSLTRANLREIQSGVKYWADTVAQIQFGGATRVRRVIPRDS
jgi:hypothetical protein